MDYKPKLMDIFNQLQEIYLSQSNTFRAKSYKKIVDALKRYPDPIKTLGDAKQVSGLTDKTVAKIAEIMRSGKSQQLEELKRADPDLTAKIELQTVLGIGAKFAEELVETYGIRSVKELQQQHKQNKIKLTRMQEIGLKYYDSLQERIPRAEIKDYLAKVQKSMHKIDKNALVIGAGSYLRGKPDSGDIDIIMAFPDIRDYEDWKKNDVIGKVAKQLKQDNLLADVISTGHNSLMGITLPGKRQLDIRIAGYETIPFYLLYFASGEDFARKIRAFAKKKGWKLTEWGITDKSGRVIANRAKDEREIFEMLGYPYVKPENR